MAHAAAHPGVRRQASSGLLGRAWGRAQTPAPVALVVM